MKKKIYPSSLFYCVTMSFFLLIILVALYVTMVCVYKAFTIKDYIFIIPIVAALCGATLFGYVFTCNVSNRMILDDKGITVTGQKMKGPIQHREFIGFSEIKNIRLICAHIDSKGRNLKIEGIASSRPHIFFEFELQDESLKLIYIEIYSIRQRKKILELINRMTNLNFSYDSLEKIDQSMFRKRQKNKR